MIAVLLWTLLGVAIFLSNHFHWTGYIGLRWSEEYIGVPINGGWLCVVVALYCLVRYFVRRRRNQNESGQSAA